MGCVGSKNFHTAVFIALQCCSVKCADLLQKGGGFVNFLGGVASVNAFDGLFRIDVEEKQVFGQRKRVIQFQNFVDVAVDALVGGC